MKFCIYIFTFSLLSVVFAETNVVNFASSQPNDRMIKIGDKMMSREHLKESLERVNQKRTGGIVRQPDSANGFFVLLNAQKAVVTTDFDGALKSIDRQVKVKIKQMDVDSIQLGTLRELIVKVGARIGVGVIDDPTLPALLAAPEEGWGLVNVRKLKDLDQKKFAARVRCEILRAFGLAAGVMHAAQGDFVLQPVMKPEDLDNIKREEFGIIALRIYSLSLPYYGITPWRQVTYKKACEEGWAPAPTNDYQKAIWDKIHEMPTEPIKIKPEARKVQR